jgi:ATP-dependent DNA helicase Q5
MLHCRCRHAVFAEYFGDNPPHCEHQCDCCVNPKAVENKVAAFYETLSKRTYVAQASAFDEDRDLYGGGRAGQKRLAFLQLFCIKVTCKILCFLLLL